MFKLVYAALKSNFNKSRFSFLFKYTALGRILIQNDIPSPCDFFNAYHSSWWLTRLWFRSSIVNSLEERVLHSLSDMINCLAFLKIIGIDDENHINSVGYHQNPSDLLRALNRLRLTQLTPENIQILIECQDPITLSMMISSLEQKNWQVEYKSEVLRILRDVSNTNLLLWLDSLLSNMQVEHIFSPEVLKRITQHTYPIALVSALKSLFTQNPLFCLLEMSAIPMNVKLIKAVIETLISTDDHTGVMSSLHLLSRLKMLTTSSITTFTTLKLTRLPTYVLTLHQYNPVTKQAFILNNHGPTIHVSFNECPFEINSVLIMTSNKTSYKHESQNLFEEGRAHLLPIKFFDDIEQIQLGVLNCLSGKAQLPNELISHILEFEGDLNKSMSQVPLPSGEEELQAYSDNLQMKLKFPLMGIIDKLHKLIASAEAALSKASRHPSIFNPCILEEKKANINAIRQLITWLCDDKLILSAEEIASLSAQRSVRLILENNPLPLAKLSVLKGQLWRHEQERRSLSQQQFLLRFERHCLWTNTNRSPENQEAFDRKCGIQPYLPRHGCL